MEDNCNCHHDSYILFLSITFGSLSEEEGLQAPNGFSLKVAACKAVSSSGNSVIVYPPKLAQITHFAGKSNPLGGGGGGHLAPSLGPLDFFREFINIKYIDSVNVSRYKIDYV